MLNKENMLIKGGGKASEPKLKCQVTEVESYTLVGLGDLRSREFLKFNSIIKDLKTEIVGLRSENTGLKLDIVGLKNKLKGIKLRKHGVES